MRNNDTIGVFVVLLVAIVEFAIIGFLGTNALSSPLFGWGGATAALFGYAGGAYAYGNTRRAGLYTGAIGSGLALSIATVILNMFVPFGSDVAGLAGLNEFVGQLAWLVIIGAVLVMLLTAIRNTTHTDLA